MFTRPNSTHLKWWYNFYVDFPRESNLSLDHLHVVIETMTFGAFLKIIHWYLHNWWIYFNTWYTEWKLRVSGIICRFALFKLLDIRWLWSFVLTYPPFFKELQPVENQMLIKYLCNVFQAAHKFFCVYYDPLHQSRVVVWFLHQSPTGPQNMPTCSLTIPLHFKFATC